MLNITVEAKKIQSEIVEMRRSLHKIPEVGLQLPLTGDYVASKLREMNIEFKMNKGDSGIIAMINGDTKGKVIALRADMDALPIIEETNLEFSADNGNMHACGHDAHAAMLLGAAKILNNNRSEIKGSVKLLFQSDEEGCNGAKAMLREGALENPSVDSILGLHIGAIFEEPKCGHIGVCYGKAMASFDKFIIKIKGKGAHGAMPHMSVDPVLISAQILISLQSIISREQKPTDPAVLTVGKISGGTAYNVIPDEVELVGTIRAVTLEQRQNMIDRMEEVVKGICIATRASYEFELIDGALPVTNDMNFTKEFVKTAENVIGKEKIIEIIEPTMGGEDMSVYLNKVPGTFFFLSSNNTEKGIVYPHHNSKFTVDEDVFWEGTALLAQGALDWLANN